MIGSPVGRLELVEHAGALVAIRFDAPPDGAPDAVRSGSPLLGDARRQLDEYFAGERRVFDLPLRPAGTAFQRRVWDVVRKAQEAAFAAVRPGAEAQALDAAARKVVDDAGFGPEYRLFTHRVGHGIGMDGHEWTYLVRGNTTRLRPGMCFSDEPGIYIPGELGIRHEDIVFVTEAGAENMTRWSGTPENPAV